MTAFAGSLPDRAVPTGTAIAAPGGPQNAASVPLVQGNDESCRLGFVSWGALPASAACSQALAQSARFGRKSGRSAGPGGAEPECPMWGRAVRQTGHRYIIPQSGAAHSPGRCSWPSRLAGRFGAWPGTAVELRFCGPERRAADGLGGWALGSARSSMGMSARGRHRGHGRESGDGGGPQGAAEAGVLVGAVGVEDGARHGPPRLRLSPLQPGCDENASARCP